MTQHADDRDAILAELRALGEDDLAEEELGLLEAPALETVRLLQLAAPSARLQAPRAQALLGEVLAEAAPPGAAERDAAAATAAAVAALLERGALPQRAANDTEADAAAAGLRRIAVARPAASLAPERASRLWDDVQRQLLRPVAAVLPFSRRAARAVAWIAAAAAILLTLGLLVERGDPALEGPVAQVDLQRAEERLQRVEAAALHQLMTAPGAAAGEHPGDHALRDLRAARYDLLVARHQARGRRL